MLQDFLKKHKVKGFRAKQFYQQFYQQAIASFDELTNWPQDLRESLKNEAEFNSLELVKEISSDKTKTSKVLMKVKRLDKNIEAVLMRHKGGRNTVCVSCMVGCPVGCKFCATGKLGFGGNLLSREIVDQILYFKRMLIAEEETVTNVVYMGMGEPMLNLREVENSLEVLTNPEQLGISKRKVTISTSGYVPQLREFIQKGFRGRIAVSLHAPNQQLRETLMPVAKQFPLPQLIDVLDEFVELTNKRITYEYILIDGVNDTPQHAKELSDLLSKRLHYVNLIPYNPIEGESFERSSKESIHRFTGILSESNINYSIRASMGDDVGAACGQLAGKSN